MLTPEERAELDGLRAELAPPVSGGLSPEERAELGSLRAELEPREATGVSAPERRVQGMGTLERLGRGVVGGIEDLGLGAVQLGNAALSGLGIPGAEERGERLRGEAQEMAARKAPLYDTMAGTVGQVLPSLAIPGSTIPKAIAGGAAYGALQPEEEEGQRLTNAAQSGAAFGAGNAVARGVGAVASKIRAPNLGGVTGTPATQARATARLKGVDELEAQGFKVSAGQRSGNRMVQGLESVFPELITTSGRAQRTAAANKVKLNELVGKSFGQSAAVRSKGVIDDEVISKAAQNIGQKIEAAIPDSHVIPPTQGMISGLADIQTKASRGLPSQVSTQLKDAVSDLYNKMFAGGSTGVTRNSGVTGGEYNVIKSQLTKLRRDLFKSNDRQGAKYVGDMERLLDDAAEESLSATPEALKSLRLARKQWGGLRVAEDSIDEAGDVSAKALKAAIKRNRPQDLVARAGRKRSDLGQLAKNIKPLQEVIADSGTPIRTGSRQLLTGIGQGGLGLYGASEASQGNFLPGAAALLGPVGAQRLLSSPGFAKYLTKVAPEAGAVGTSLSEIYRRGAGAGAFGSMQEVYGQ